MPIYEYLCRTCETRFEEFVRDGDAMLAHCPECGASEVNRLLSLFATAGDARSSISQKSGAQAATAHACGCGSCSCGSH